MKVLMTKYTTAEQFEICFTLLEMDGIYHFYGQLTLNGKEVESCMTIGITDERRCADKIFDILVSEKVFPSHFYYVIDEILE